MTEYDDRVQRLRGAVLRRRAQAATPPAVHATMTTTHSAECPCGRARAGCEYHDPALQPAAVAATVTLKLTPEPGAPQAQPLREIRIGGLVFYAEALTVRSIRSDGGVHELVFGVPAASPAAPLIQAMYTADMLAYGRGVRLTSILIRGVVSTKSAWWAGAVRLHDTVTYTMRWAGAGPQVSP